MSTLEEIGVLLGFAAFAGVAVLAFLTFHQARHLRRLRDWAGRAPERAVAAAEREAAAERQDAPEPDAEPEAAPESEGPGRIAVAIETLKLRYAELDRRMPVDARFLAAGLLAIALGVGVATSGFGLVGSDGERAGPGGGAAEQREAQRERRAERRSRPRVAVLNGSAGPDGVAVQGAADVVSRDVRAAGYRIGAVDNTEPVPTSTIMFKAGSEEQAAELAEGLAERLGSLETAEMTPAVELVANGADLALVIGQDYSGE